MTKPVTISYTFATASGNVPASELDSNFSVLAQALNDLATFSNIGTDSGSANSYIINYTSGITLTLENGVQTLFNPLNASTGASTINVAGTGSLPLLRPDLSPIQAGDIKPNHIYTATYNASQGSWVLDTLVQPTIPQVQASNGYITLGTPGGPTKPTIIAWGFFSGNTTGGSGVSLTFQTPFPNIVWIVIPIIGNNNANGLTCQLINADTTQNGFSVQVFQNGGSYANSAVQLNYIAIGN